MDHGKSKSEPSSYRFWRIGIFFFITGIVVVGVVIVVLSCLLPDQHVHDAAPLFLLFMIMIIILFITNGRLQRRRRRRCQRRLSHRHGHSSIRQQILMGDAMRKVVPRLARHDLQTSSPEQHFLWLQIHIHIFLRSCQISKGHVAVSRQT
jgi:hypothetical protein